MKVCKNCGKVLDDQATFCSLCGASVYTNLQRPIQSQTVITPGGINQIIAAAICLIILFIPGFFGEDSISFQVSAYAFRALSYLSSIEVDEIPFYILFLCIGVLPYLVLTMSILSIISVVETSPNRKKSIINSSIVAAGFVIGIFSYFLIFVYVIIDELRGYFSISITDVLGVHGVILLGGTLYLMIGCSMSLNEIKRDNRSQSVSYSSSYSAGSASYSGGNQRSEVLVNNGGQANSHGKVTPENRIGYIQGVSGVNKSALIALQANDTVIIGRDPKYSQLIVADTGVSKKHCLVSYEPQKDRYILVDVSTNGVYLGNGKRLPANTKVALEHDTQFTLGHTKESFRLV